MSEVYVITCMGKRIGTMSMDDDYMITLENGFDNSDKPKKKTQSMVNPEEKNKKWHAYRTVPEYVEARRAEEDEIVGGNIVKSGWWVIRHRDGTYSVCSPLEFEQYFMELGE